MDKIEIPLSKLKILFVIVGSALFVFSGLYICTTISDGQTRYNPIFLKAVGIVGILFFGATGLYGIKKMFETGVGLIIDENGITDNTNAYGIGLIKWTDITAIKTKQVMRTKFLLIYTNDPNKILDSVTGIKRKFMNGNLKMYGTPFSKTSNTLKYNFEDLERLLNGQLNKQREKITNPKSS